MREISRETHPVSMYRAIGVCDVKTIHARVVLDLATPLS